jgi:Cu/Ag efflux protein CusF
VSFLINSNRKIAMKTFPFHAAWLTLAASLCVPSSFAVEARGAGATGTSAAVATVGTLSESGTVTKIDLRAGYIVLADDRRFTFRPGAVTVFRQNDQRTPGKLSDVKVGSKVSLTVNKSPSGGTSTVTELWLAP